MSDDYFYRENRRRRIIILIEKSGVNSDMKGREENCLHEKENELADSSDDDFEKKWKRKRK